MLKNWWRGGDNQKLEPPKTVFAPCEIVGLSAFIAKACQSDYREWPPQQSIRLFLSEVSPEILDTPEVIREMASFLFFNGNRVELIVNMPDRSIHESRLVHMIANSANARVFDVHYPQVRYSLGLVGDGYFYAEEGGCCGIYVKNALNTDSEAGLKNLENIWQVVRSCAGGPVAPKLTLVP